MATYDLVLQAAIDAASVSKDAGDSRDLRTILLAELDERDVQTTDEAWIQHVVDGIQSDPNFMTSEQPADFTADER